MLRHAHFVIDPINL